MSSADILSLAIAAGALLVALAIPVITGRRLARQFHGSSGKRYGDMFAELVRETERRGDLVLAWGEAQASRLERTERRRD